MLIYDFTAVAPLSSRMDFHIIKAHWFKILCILGQFNEVVKNYSRLKMFSAIKKKKIIWYNIGKQLKKKKKERNQSKQLTPDHRMMLLKKRSSVGEFSFFFPTLPNACDLPCSNATFFVH